MRPLGASFGHGKDGVLCSTSVRQRSKVRVPSYSRHLGKEDYECRREQVLGWQESRWAESEGHAVSCTDTVPFGPA